MFCEHCGKPVPSDASFCEHCGKPIESEVQSAPQTPPKSTAVRAGFSEKINHPSFREAVKKTERGTSVFAVLLILAPVVITLALGVKNDDFSYFGVGAMVSAVFLVFNLVLAAKKKAEKPWDGEVIDKQTRRALDRNLEDKGSRHYTEYITVFRDASGKSKKYTEGTPTNDAHPFYDYLSVGDRVRYHPEFSGFYEKYDKSGDTRIYCPVCGCWNDIAEDVCENCGTVLLK